MAEEVILEFAHFGNGVSGNDVLITSDLVLVNVGEEEIRPVVYFFGQDGRPARGGIRGGPRRTISKWKSDGGLSPHNRDGRHWAN